MSHINSSVRRVAAVSAAPAGGPASAARMTRHRAMKGLMSRDETPIGASVQGLPEPCQVWYFASVWGIDQDDFGSKRSKVINLIDSKKIEHDFIRKVCTLF